MIRVTQVDSEEELEKFSVWNMVFSFLRGKLNDTSIDVDLYSNKTCLKVELLEPGTTYSILLFRRTSCPRWGKGAWGCPGDSRTGQLVIQGPVPSSEREFGLWKEFGVFGGSPGCCHLPVAGGSFLPCPSPLGFTYLLSRF